MLSALVIAAALQVTPAQLQRIRWVPNPRTQSGTWVADPSRHLRPVTIDSLNAIIGALEHETGAEIAVVVVDSTSGLEPSDFALALHRGWGVGKAGRDNGVVFLWLPTQRALHISVGTGLEGVLPDRRVGRIRDEEIFPAFRRGAFDEGVLAGVRALATAAREEPTSGQRVAPGAARGAPTSGVGGTGSGDGGALIIGFLTIALGLGGVGWGIRRLLRFRSRPCPNGHGGMRRVDETADDQYLDEAERLEERIGSVDHDVWLCGVCGHTIKVPRRRWFSGYRDCPECKRRTVEVKTSTLRHATEFSEGLRHVVETCKHCSYKKEYDQTIPRLTRSSAGRSAGSKLGGGGGFGGGTARGGGAGGRY